MIYVYNQVRFDSIYLNYFRLVQCEDSTFFVHSSCIGTTHNLDEPIRIIGIISDVAKVV